MINWHLDDFYPPKVGVFPGSYRGGDLPEEMHTRTPSPGNYKEGEPPFELWTDMHAAFSLVVQQKNVCINDVPHDQMLLNHLLIFDAFYSMLFQTAVHDVHDGPPDTMFNLAPIGMVTFDVHDRFEWLIDTMEWIGKTQNALAEYRQLLDEQMDPVGNAVIQLRHAERAIQSLAPLTSVALNVFEGREAEDGRGHFPSINFDTYAHGVFGAYRLYHYLDNRGDHEMANAIRSSRDANEWSNVHKCFAGEYNARERLDTIETMIENDDADEARALQDLLAERHEDHILFWTDFPGVTLSET